MFDRLQVNFFIAPRGFRHISFCFGKSRRIKNNKIEVFPAYYANKQTHGFYYRINSQRKNQLRCKFFSGGLHRHGLDISRDTTRWAPPSATVNGKSRRCKRSSSKQASRLLLRSFLLPAGREEACFLAGNNINFKSQTVSNISTAPSLFSLRQLPFDFPKSSNDRDRLSLCFIIRVVLTGRQERFKLMFLCFSFAAGNRKSQRCIIDIHYQAGKSRHFSIISR